MRHGRNNLKTDSATQLNYSNLHRGNLRRFANINQNRTVIHPSYNTYYNKEAIPNQAKTTDISIPKKTENRKIQTNAVTNRINSRIKDIKQKIEKQIITRRKIIAKNINKDICIKSDDKELFRLKPELIDFLVDRSEKNVIQKHQYKNQLEKLNFKLDSGQEDIFVKEKTILHTSESTESLLESDYSEWRKWKSIIKHIGKNIDNYKISKKGKQLNTLFDEYKTLTQEETEEKSVICEECGSKNPAQALHCHYCGAKL